MTQTGDFNDPNTIRT